MTETIKICYLPDSPELEQIEKGGCIDLYNYEDITLSAGQFGLISLGVAMELPDGYDAIVIPRSSCFKRHSIILVNSPGYIDNAYKGTDDIWYAPVYAMNDTYIPKGTRCFQFRLVEKQPQIEFQRVRNLDYNENRAGLGSTGA